MTATTTKLGLRYPTGSDSPCEGGQQIIDLRDDIYGYLDAYTDVVTRQADLPMVSVAWLGAPQVVLAGTGDRVRFDTVEQDDVRAADLTTASDQIVLGQPGFEGTYLTGFMVALAAAADGYTQDMSGDMIATYSPVDFDLDHFFQFGTPPGNPVMSGSTLALIGGPTTMKLFHTGLDQVIVLARLWAVRIGSL